MLALVQQLLTSQFEASLSTLGLCVEQCPESLWHKPVARFPFCMVAFHTLFYADFYLGLNEAALRDQPFHRENPTLFGGYEQLEDIEPVTLYDKSQIRLYLAFCRDKAREVLAAETEATLAAPAEFPRKPFSRAELHVYNIRHIQHHTAQLILRLRLDSTVNIPWVRSGWQESQRGDR